MLSTLFRLRRTPLRAVRPPAPPPVAEEAEDPAGCGWFASSADLQRGLLVVEMPVSEFVEGRHRRLHCGNGLAPH